MNTNPNAKVILCYGDSNTRGNTPQGDRYPVDVRWTGLLQSQLGQDFYIIEEGLGGRTTALEDLTERPGKNGKTYLLPCLNSHNPIDIVILMLGTNDLKERFSQSPKDIVRNVEDLVTMIQEIGMDKNNKAPKIILLSPPLVDESVPSSQKNYHGAAERSKLLAPLYQEIAQKYDCEFIDIAQIAQPSNVDGLHLEQEAHRAIANILFANINDNPR
jgi:lysophospholipase L1-like esterase